MKIHRLVAIVCVATTASCGSDSTGPADDCDVAGLPLSGSEDGPVVVAVSLEVQPGGIVLLATATDPQGSENLLGVQQSISVFPNARCTGTPITVRDDLAGSGVEESFGTAIAAGDDAALYGSIAAASSWPVSVDFRDQDGNRTFGRVMAAVID
ncbi:MAG TPA: hypothetical protein VHG09_00705 [Longimicrobiales bacterium]|nr:hypothetical protein [Longimicrobiales bacterium]